MIPDRSIVHVGLAVLSTLSLTLASRAVPSQQGGARQPVVLTSSPQAQELAVPAGGPESLIALSMRVPAGAVLPFAGDTPPAGYLLCNGQEVLQDDYPALYSAIGEAWGSATSFTFTLPDLRGRFLRGVDGGAGNDPDRNSRGAINPGGNVGDNVGSVQGDGRRGFSGTFGGSTASAGSHKHDIWTYQDDYDEDDGSTAHAPGWADDARSSVTPVNINDTDFDGSHSHSFNVNVSFTGDAESRPKNAGVNFIIKF